MQNQVDPQLQANPQQDPGPEQPQMQMASQIEPAGFWIRFVALIIDAIVVGIVIWPIQAALMLALVPT